MALKIALEQRRVKALTPYNPEAWEHLLISSGLISRYAHIPESLCTSFTACTPLISSTYTPPNHPSILEHRDTFESSVTKEFTLGHYLGPYLLEINRLLWFVYILT